MTGSDIVDSPGAKASIALDHACDLLAAARTVDDVLDLRDRAEAMQFYLRRRDAGSAAHADAYEIVQRANRRLGELLRELPTAERARTDLSSTDGTQTKISALRELGIPKVTAHRLEKLAALPEDEFRARLETQRAKVTKQADPGGMTATTAASEHDGDAWGTPDNYLEAARTVLDGIELDPATNEAAQLRVKAERYFTREQDGLAQPWVARSLWLNPPFSAGLVSRMCNRFGDAVEEETIGAGLLLVNACTEVEWFQRLLGACKAVCFPDERISFLDAAGNPVHGNAYRQAIFYAGPKLPLFAKTFRPFGRICVEYSR
jgi:hypothetical protein